MQLHGGNTGDRSAVRQAELKLTGPSLEHGATMSRFGAPKFLLETPGERPDRENRL